MEQPSSEQDFLLVTAGQRAGHPIRIGWSQFERVDLLSRCTPLGTLAQQTSARET